MRKRHVTFNSLYRPRVGIINDKRCKTLTSRNLISHKGNDTLVILNDQRYKTCYIGTTGPTGTPGPAGPQGNTGQGPTGNKCDTTLTVKSFVIDHPVDEDKYLVHVCLEGPEAGVYYRGKSSIINGQSVNILLPEYVKHFAKNFSIHVTPMYNSQNINNQSTFTVSDVEDGQFTVYGPNGGFFWIVYGERCEIVVEPKKSDVNLMGAEPYRWISKK